MTYPFIVNTTVVAPAVKHAVRTGQHHIPRIFCMLGFSFARVLDKCCRLEALHTKQFSAREVRASVPNAGAVGDKTGEGRTRRTNISW